MTDPHAEARRIAGLVLSDPGSAGVFYATQEAQDETENAIRLLLARVERLRDIERAARILDAAGPNWTWSEWKDSGMAAALSTPEADA